MPMVSFASRGFSDASAVMSQDGTGDEVDLRDENARLGVDTEFSQQKHAYVLTFPWNFDEIIDEFQGRYRPIGGFWATFVNNSGAIGEFNNLFREFHQMCAQHDAKGVEKVCEGRLAQAVNESLDRIHFHGLDVEMANLTVTQPNIQILKVEISHGIGVERDANGAAEDWQVSESSLLGAPCSYYTPSNDQRDCIDGLDADHKPYKIAVTAMVESPMKLYVLNQNHSKVLFGSEDEENIKNVVRFEANLRWFDFMNLLPVENKNSIGQWKITDFNNVLNENPLF
jgi:hypothetical protein